MLHQALGLLDDHLSHLNVALGRFVEGRADHLGIHVSPHIGDLLGPLVYEQNDEDDLLVVGDDRIGDLLHEHGLAGPRRGDDQATLPLAERRGDVQHPHAQVVRGGLQVDLLFRVQRRQVDEGGFVLGRFRWLVVDRIDLEQGEVPFVVLGGTHLALDGVPGAQVQPADLRRRHVDVVRTGQVVVVRRPEKTESILQDLENTAAPQFAVLVCLFLEDGKNEFLLGHIAVALDIEGSSKTDEFLYFFVF